MTERCKNDLRFDDALSASAEVDLFRKRAQFFAPTLNSCSNAVPHNSCANQLFRMRSAERRRIGKTPVQAIGRAGKDRAAFRAGLIANSDDVGELPARLKEIRDPLRLI